MDLTRIASCRSDDQHVREKHSWLDLCRSVPWSWIAYKKKSSRSLFGDDDARCAQCPQPTVQSEAAHFQSVTQPIQVHGSPTTLLVPQVTVMHSKTFSPFFSFVLVILSIPPHHNVSCIPVLPNSSCMCSQESKWEKRRRNPKTKREYPL